MSSPVNSVFDGSCYLDKFGIVPTPYWIAFISVLISDFTISLISRLFFIRRFSLWMQYELVRKVCKSCRGGAKENRDGAKDEAKDGTEVGAKDGAAERKNWIDKAIKSALEDSFVPDELESLKAKDAYKSFLPGAGDDTTQSCHSAYRCSVEMAVMDFLFLCIEHNTKYEERQKIFMMSHLKEEDKEEQNEQGQNEQKPNEEDFSDSEISVSELQTSPGLAGSSRLTEWYLKEGRMCERLLDELEKDKHLAMPSSVDPKDRRSYLLLLMAAYSLVQTGINVKLVIQWLSMLKWPFKPKEVLTELSQAEEVEGSHDADRKNERAERSFRLYVPKTNWNQNVDLMTQPGDTDLGDGKVDWYRHAVILFSYERSTFETLIKSRDDYEILLNYHCARWKLLLKEKFYPPILDTNGKRCTLEKRGPRTKYPYDHLDLINRLSSRCCGSVFTEIGTVLVHVNVPKEDGSFVNEDDEYYWELYYKGLNIGHFEILTDQVFFSYDIDLVQFLYLIVLTIASLSSIIWTVSDRPGLNNWERYQLYCMMVCSSTAVRAQLQALLRSEVHTRLTGERSHFASLVLKLYMVIQIASLPVLTLPMAVAYCWVVVSVGVVIEGLLQLVRYISNETKLGSGAMMAWIVYTLTIILQSFQHVVFLETLPHYAVSLYAGNNYIYTISNEFNCRSTEKWLKSVLEHADLYMKNVLAFF